MAGEFASYRAQARRIVHDTMAVPVTYTPPGGGVAVDLAVRWHGKMDLIGDLVAQGYGQGIEGVHKVIFDLDQLAQKGISLEERGVITTETGAALILMALEPGDGIVKETWRCSQKA